MVLDSKIQLCKDYFGCSTPEDWEAIEPAWILKLEGIGPVTLDHIRMYLAARGLTLKGDRTPEYWQQHLSAARICHTMGDPEEPGADVHQVVPFTVLVDSQEKQPFTFEGIKADADQKNRPLIVPTRWESLGIGKGDYQIDGMRDRVSIERKAKSDAHGTILGWASADQRERDQYSRRDRFERELETLNDMQFACVVVECSLGDLLMSVPQWGKKTVEDNRKSLYRSILAWQQRYKGVQWLFCDSRRLAEVTTFRILERFWKDAQRESRRENATDNR